ncbi:type III secretion system outer membrane ring subunit SctC [Roseateles amylovorans]|uniref:Type 3 secretion system secretin n=1 Tax=Roseateles amylovorans TaxID=2978473 RepID=A0ABY6B8I3_9BURK|nr:type III secretion system outer membrane ring subunit SctC [Roseateles amylovorans]UXH79522.1 type III secretion system outer membrane ring subunit SctC [Roseateles amylovorans]
MKREATSKWAPFCIGALLLLASACVTPDAGAVTPAAWKEVRYSYRADEETTLGAVLDSFAAAMGLQLRLSDEKLRSRKVTLKGRGLAPDQFLDQLAQSQMLEWFVYQGVLHISPPSGTVTQRLELSTQSAASARQALIGLGLFEQKFGWGELDTDPPAVLVGGPAAYVAHVRRALRPPTAPPAAPKAERPKMMVFRLKHAVASDRQMSVRGQVTTSPGLATTLRQILSDGRDLSDVGRATGRNAAASPSTPVQPAAQGFGAMPAPMGAGTSALQSLQDTLTGLSSGALLASQLPGAGSAAGLGAIAPSSPAPARRAAAVANPPVDVPENHDRLPVVAAYAPLNAVLIWDLPSRRPEYEALIADLDQAVRQVEINVEILDVNTNALRDWAVDLTAGSGAARVQINPAGTVGASAGESSQNSSMVLWATDRLTLRLRALESRGEARVLSRPSLLTQDNVGAVLDMSQSINVRLVGERAVDLRTVTAGTSLRVTPSIVGEGEDATVRVTLDIEDGALKNTDGDQANPMVGNSAVSTQAVVRQGESLVVGGYRRQNTETVHSRVPGLHSLPLLGWLFRSDSAVTDERERLFILTARIVK